MYMNISMAKAMVTTSKTLVQSIIRNVNGIPNYEIEYSY